MTALPNSTLVLGGARSGKSRFAENLVTSSGLERHYIATGRAWDEEMQARIDQHKADRGASWTTHEEPLALAERLAAIDGAGRAILVDCLTLWLTNLMMEGRDIATNVFPETDFKFWLDAQPEERARRRRAQGVEEDLAGRDRQDSQRAAIPLMIGLGARRIDTTGRPVSTVVAEIAAALRAP